METVGLPTTAMSISNWRSGKNIPAQAAREKMALAPFEILVTSWDLNVETTIKPATPKPKKPKAPKPTGLLNAEAVAREYLERIAKFRDAYSGRA
jgi:hypothetical protein